MGQRSSDASDPALWTEAGRALPQVGPLPPCWAQVLDCIQGAVPGSDLGAAVLVPLVFGARRIGAMLLVLPPGGQGQASLSLGGPGALEALGACVAECCLGPVLPAVEQVAVASSAVASAASLSELATALTSSLSSALSAELHVDLTVRLAVLPYKEAGSGVLFSTATDGAASKSGMLPFASTTGGASPRLSTLGGASRQGPVAGSQGRQAQSTRVLAASPAASPFTWLSQSPSQAILRGVGLAQGSRSGTLPFAASGGGGVLADDDAAEVTLMPNEASMHRNVATPNSATMNAGGGGGLLTSIVLESFLGSRQVASMRQGSVPGSTAAQRVAWKACPFTRSSTLLAALLSGKAGAEVNSSASQLPAGSMITEPELRAEVVPDVPAFLHDFERPSKDVFSIVRRAGVGGLASLVTISAAWAAPAAPFLLSTAAAERGCTSPGPAEVARLPALGVYIYSALPLPQSLLLAARDHAAGLLKVLAPGVIRVLSCGLVADQWAVLAGQAMGGSNTSQPSARAMGVPSSNGGSAVFGRGAGGSGAGADAGAIHAFIVDAAADTFHSAVPSSKPASRVLPTSEPPSRLASLKPPPIRVSVAGAAGDTGIAINTEGVTMLTARRQGPSSCTLDAVAATYSSGSRTTLGPGQFAKMQPSSKSLVINRSNTIAVAPAHAMLTASVSAVSAFTTTLARTRTETDLQGSVHAEDDIRALTISRPIGQGACSVVMLGRLHAMPVAVKVILPLEADDQGADQGPTGRSRSKLAELALLDNPPLWSGPIQFSSDSSPSDVTGSTFAQLAQARASAVRGTTLRRRKRLQALMRGARELAVLTSISHPNIVQVYSHCTRVVVEEPEPFRPRLRVVPEGEEVGAPVCSALIMEFCDMGSLADAIDTGMFAKAAKKATAHAHALGSQPLAAAAAAGTPAMRAVYLTLLEVALALRHLHSMNLVHCDVKPANVLLRSSATDPRGFTAKLTDFGFVTLASNLVAREGSGTEGSPQEPVGTITHMAPELFINGAHVDSSIDCYAFGILMWETYTGRAPYPAYADTNFAEVPDKVSKEGLRPPFPPETPLNFKQLAQECWSAAPSQRPSAASLVVRLQALLDASCGSA
ncbi:hypothetical protein HYH03_017932 [Edaphochlamys debaryana]|uniref:Protein kinase domain-containing protein n=1 Tax=Edaphochlamys debaryana TaxID=47281 RepID=A0A835XES2_9CHLO|nr:hypothetical protein HYH03_017932 [Edaphochlamys debaryana]|eukprot:KAG2483197.1 hypothetical protein HYH03_017932 [Edaphochlamys debaryana]